jgi:cbb3-type cytochrome oxidase cytochrome c subunit
MKKFLIPSIICLFFILTASRPTENNHLYNLKVSPSQNPPMSPLALYGQHIFEREKCGNCHKMGLSYTFVSLENLGGKYTDIWHCQHLENPQKVSPYSIMPAYPNLLKNDMDKEMIGKIIAKGRKEGIKYPQNLEKVAKKRFFEEADEIAKKLDSENIQKASFKNKEIVAIIAYLQQLGASPQKKAEDSLMKEKKDFMDALVFETMKKVVLPVASSNHKDTIALGKPLFERNCKACHGSKGEGIIGANLTDDYWLYGGSVEDILNTVMKGVPEKGMPAWKGVISDSDIAKVVCYVRSLSRK